MQVTVNSDILDECVTFGDYIKVLTEEISDQTKLYKYRIQLKIFDYRFEREGSYQKFKDKIFH